MQQQSSPARGRVARSWKPTRRGGAAIGMLAAVALAVSACATSGGASGDPAVSGASNAGAASSAKTAGPSSAAKNDPNAVACGRMQIGIIGPLTGPSSSFGAADKNSAVLAIDEYNQEHPDCKVTLVDFDTQGEADKAPAAAQKAVQNSSIVAILGPEFSGGNAAALPILDQAGMPTVTSDATNGALSSHGWKVFHRTVASDDVEGPGEAFWTVKQAGMKSIAVIDNGQAYGQGIAQTFAVAVPKVGGKVAMKASIDAKASDYSSTVVSIKGSGADAVFCGCLYAEAARLLKQIRDGGLKVMYISDAGAIEPDFGKIAGQDNAEGAIAGQTGVIKGESNAADELFTKYVKKFGEDAPQTYVAEGYDAAQAILKAVADGNHSRSSINTYLGKVSFDGASGHVEFKPNGDRTTASMSMLKYTSGKWKFLTEVDVPEDLLPK